MKFEIDDLKPKANKLLEFVTHQQLAEPAKTKDLTRFFYELPPENNFPLPVTLFFKLPLFQELLQIIEEGKPFQEDLSPRFQTFVEAFHKLVHLDYKTETIDDPLVQAKILAQNVQEYLIAADIFFPYEGKILEEILSYLFQSVRTFAENFKQLVLAHESLFSAEMIQHIGQPFFLQLCNLERSNFKISILEDWYPITIELSLDPKLAIQTKQLSSLVKANAHKLLNQLQTVLAKKRQFYQRNISSYIPHEIEEKILQGIDGPLPGQKINELFYALFSEEKYAIIESKEHPINHKCSSFVHAIWPIKESLFSLVNTYNFFLPENFSDYLLDVIQPLGLDSKIFGKPNHLAVGLILGLYTVQYDYLTELLNPTGIKDLPPALCKKIYDLLPILFSFMESYYSFRPAPSFATIKSRLERLYSGEDGIKIHSPEEVKQRLSQTLALYMPSKAISLDLLTASLQKLVKDLQSFYSELPEGSLESILLRERLKYLAAIDLPSFSQSWFAIGEILGIFVITLSRTEDLFHEKIGAMKNHLIRHPFIQAMFS